MKDLIEALEIFAKYTDAYYPTSCGHDVLHVQVDPDKVSTQDKRDLEKLGFIPDEETNTFLSFRFGSC